MSWTLVGAAIQAASLLQVEPERTALAELGRELRRLAHPQAVPESSR